MKIRFMAAMLLCLLLSGCAGIFDGEYSSVRPHGQENTSEDFKGVSVSNYSQLYDMVAELIETGTETDVISVSGYDQSVIRSDMNRVIERVICNEPVAAYAVENIRYEIGKRGGQPVLAVDISFRCEPVEIRRIKQVRGEDGAYKAIGSAMKDCQSSVVLLIQEYEEIDFSKLVKSYAQDHPQFVMELPRVVVELYPESGESRVAQIRFQYQNSEGKLKSMQRQVSPVFDSAWLYVVGDGPAMEKYSQLYSFLMERHNYRIERSITPAFSLLRHGIGDSHAFASVYAAMCRGADLECRIVTGTKDGQPYSWNMICANGVYYHVDLLSGQFQGRADADMQGYVWDTADYPACVSALQ